MKNMITGGMSEDEARSMLLKRGIQAFKTVAGSLPQKEPEISKFGDLPMFRAFHNSQVWDEDYEFVQYSYSVWLQCEEPMCEICCDMLEIAIQPVIATNFRYVRIVAWYDDKSLCACCGEVCRDDIPF